jgi:hypothetical protein
MIASDDCSEPDWKGYEPDWEDLAYWDYEQEVFESLRLEHGDIEGELRDYHKHTDRQLRGLSKEAKSLARELWNEYQFDLADDSFEVLLEDGETSITVSRDGSCRYEVPRPLPRKDKRRKKTARRRGSRHLMQLGFLTKRGCSPRQVKGYEDMSVPRMVAAV